MSTEVRSNKRTGSDRALTAIADYVPDYRVRDRKVFEIGRGPSAVCHHVQSPL